MLNCPGLGYADRLPSPVLVRLLETRAGKLTSTGRAEHIVAAKRKTNTRMCHDMVFCVYPHLFAHDELEFGNLSSGLQITSFDNVSSRNWRETGVRWAQLPHHHHHQKCSSTTHWQAMDGVAPEPSMSLSFSYVV